MLKKLEYSLGGIIHIKDRLYPSAYLHLPSRAECSILPA